MSRVRVVIENISPQVDGGRFAAKRVLGDTVAVEADAFTDGHDKVRCVLLHRAANETEWQETAMTALGNDRWRASFVPEDIGPYLYTVKAWLEPLLDWQKAAAKGPDPALTLQHEPPLTLHVDRKRAGYSTWYEFFPRSAGSKPGKHGTFADCEALLPHIAEMGFDVLYLPPIHPIGKAFRKGANNSLTPREGEPGSPWAIGGAEGGHKSIHPELGTEQDLHRLVTRANGLGIELALDIAFQASPDHPYVREHPEWFLHRPDGTIQYAENPPKKYQDIYPFHFEGEAWLSLWQELKSVVEHWIARGVRIFRVDNPHTKPFAMWEWLIGEIRRERPDIIFLAEAFTRPKVMYRLAKLGFSQSYTYFSWRNGKRELIEYFTELGKPPVSDFFRPNLWPNTPDILTEYLQFGGRPAFMIRLVLAATLGANYGIYGPAFELMEHEPREPGSEEYLDSEKYQLRSWDLGRADSLRDLIARVNRIRHDNPALHSDRNLRFHDIDNENVIAYSKTTDDHSDSVLAVVNLDPHHSQSGWLELDLKTLGLPADQAYQAHDLLSGARFLWKGARNYVSLDTQSPAHLFRIRRKVRTERDFDYFL
jgi:starch synthase (maltosyl-transferring)